MTKASWLILAWIIASPCLAEAKDWDVQIGHRAELAWGRIFPYSGTYSEHVVETGPSGNRPVGSRVDVGGPTSNGQPAVMLLTLGGRWKNLLFEVGVGLESVRSGLLRYEGSIGVRAPMRWRLGYESELVSAYPAILLGGGWGYMENTPSSEYDYFRRVGPFGTASFRYQVRIAKFFVRAEVRYRAMASQRQEWIDQGDPGQIEYRFEGWGFSHDVALGLALGVAI